MNEFEKIKEKIIKDAQYKLGDLDSRGVDIKDEYYKDYLQSLAAGKCRICKSSLEVVYAEESEDRYKYKFACGHGINGITLHDTFIVRDSLRLRKSKTGVVRFIYESISGWFPSIRKDLSPDGVTKVRVIDRENDYYKEEVVDVKTGRIIRSIEEKLSEHYK